MVRKVKKDTYRDYAHLTESEKEYVDYQICVRSTKSQIVVLAPHGGRIERHTSKIARLIAGETHNLYLFEGIKKNGNRILHITSTNFDEPNGVELVESCDFAIAVHGKDDPGRYVEVGGANRDLVSAVTQALIAAGFEAKEPSGSALAGEDPQNICNRAKRQGVQLEMCSGMRDMLNETDNAGRLTLFANVTRTAVEDHLMASSK